MPMASSPLEPGFRGTSHVSAHRLLARVADTPPRAHGAHGPEGASSRLTYGPSKVLETLQRTLQWADPNLADAAGWMARLVNEPSLRSIIGAHAARSIVDYQKEAEQ